jgi:hypothetical protein
MAALKDFILRCGSTFSIGAAKNLGGAIDMTTPIPEGGIVGGLWDNVSADEAVTGKTEFRCFYLKNTHSSVSLLNPILVVQKDTESSSDFISVGWGLSLVNVAEQSIATESTYPNNVTFYSGATAGTGAILGRDIPPMGYKAVWLRRTVGFGAQSQAFNEYTIRLLSDNISEEIAESGDIPNPSPTTTVIITGQMDNNIFAGGIGTTATQIIAQTNAWIANLFLMLGIAGS